MTKTAFRTYEVNSSDFPIHIVIRARQLDSCDAVVGAVQVIKDSTLVDTIPVEVVENDKTTKSYDIRKPARRSTCDLVQTVTAFFGKKPPENARYDITITSAQDPDEEFPTSIRVPTIDPGIANLTFQYR